MARLALLSSPGRAETPHEEKQRSQDEVSTTEHLKIRGKLKSIPEKHNTCESHAEEQSAKSKQGKVSSNLEHVDSMMLPSLNGATSKSYQQGLLAVKEGEQSPVRATPRRHAKQPISYAVGERSVIYEDDESQGSDWSQIDESVSDDDESELEDLQPRQLWSSHSRKLFQVHKPLSVVDLTSPKRAPRGPTDESAEALRRTRTKSSSDDDRNAILRFSPPRSRSPLKKPPETTPSRPVTPPLSPSRSKLNSPSKSQRTRIPPTPHRPSIDAFWSQEIVNAWNDEYSPKKVLSSPRKPLFPTNSNSNNIKPASTRINSTDDDLFLPSSTPQSPTKSRSASPTKSTTNTAAARAAAAAKKAFEANKHELATTFLAELDNTITSGAIARLAASTGGVKLVWSNKLNTTAGRANWKCETVRSRTPAAAPTPATTLTATISRATTPTTKPSTTTTAETVAYRHHASIELATKVIDCEPRLLNVLAHEYCHLANFMVSKVRDQPHGASFKRWAALVSERFGDRGVEVTTKHTYEISYRYAWVCGGGGRGLGVGREEEAEGSAGCGMEYQRHSKSIDPQRHTCGVCKGRLVQIRPMPRGRGSKSAEGASASARAEGATAGKGQSEYQAFVKEHFKVVRSDLGTASPMKDVMKELGARYRLLKQDKVMESGSTEPGSPTKRRSAEKVKEIEVIEISDSEDEDGGEGVSIADGVEEEGGDELELPDVLEALTISDD